MKHPNLFVIGAPKCGTTSLYHYLNNHYDIFLPDIKEQHFFSMPEVKDTYYDVYFANDMNEYLNNYDKARDEKILADVSPSYLYHCESAEKIVEFNSESKIIVILRDPVDRAISHYLMDLRIGYVNKSLHYYLNKKDSLRYREYVMNGFYYKSIHHYKKIFGKNLLVVSFNDFKNDTGQVLSEIFNFLDIENIKVDFSQKHNTYSHSRGLIMYYFRLFKLLKLFKLIAPESLKNKIKKALSNNNKGKPSFKCEREILKYIYRNESKQLERIFGRRYW